VGQFSVGDDISEGRFDDLLQVIVVREGILGVKRKGYSSLLPF